MALRVAFLALVGVYAEQEPGLLPLRMLAPTKKWEIREWRPSLRADSETQYGMFASRDFPPGAVVLREAPLLETSDGAQSAWIATSKRKNNELLKKLQRKSETLPPNEERRFADKKDRDDGLVYDTYVEEALLPNLSPEKLKDFWSLRDVYNLPTEKSVGGVLQTNMYRSAEGRKGLFSRISRINHSCEPNCEVAFKESPAAADNQSGLTSYTGHVRARRRIRDGDQLFVSYGGTLLERKPRKVRRAWLRDQLGFSCECERCRREADTAEL